jgi:hypothetical protein
MSAGILFYYTTNDGKKQAVSLSVLYQPSALDVWDATTTAYMVALRYQ